MPVITKQSANDTHGSISRRRLIEMMAQQAQFLSTETLIAPFAARMELDVPQSDRLYLLLATVEGKYLKTDVGTLQIIGLDNNRFVSRTYNPDSGVRNVHQDIEIVMAEALDEKNLGTTALLSADLPAALFGHSKRVNIAPESLRPARMFKMKPRVFVPTLQKRF